MNSDGNFHKNDDSFSLPWGSLDNKKIYRFLACFIIHKQNSLRSLLFNIRVFVFFFPTSRLHDIQLEI